MIENKFKVGDFVKLIFFVLKGEKNNVFEIIELKKTFNYVNVGNQKLLSSYYCEYKIINLKNGFEMNVLDGDIELDIAYRRKRIISDLI